ncbi:phosphocarrier protein HPr /phosphoenolpyruvate--protein phosphotransferase /PTS system IIA component (Glc family) [Aliiruegeria haliotis]|uniref:phosphoenolpyruvate--protein phosphotransferase n=1 Tax=Aliiruegeria haliotis TaxID=1280846 RepID=A0A2T0RTR3_9RHOB|nr:phosphoenolpyruvate--protein phosphotransferase [Aliiruegeria haliotis]PRY24500.1 phosphocarrier protein HPr /phosphoenolpyruvate--protein phosphotransferase /PTS system IIA component (Glc family) [Aliiruegeria haliotis]
MARVELVAPLDGVMLPLEQVPDPVFAQKMVGDGISIDPLNDLLTAPIGGTITQVHRAGHAVTVTSPEGVEVMLHVGLDTVALKGEGFSPKVAEGDSVATGDPLIGFDPDYLATHAKSLLTQVIVTNSDAMSGMTAATGTVSAGKDVVLTLETSAITEQEVAGGETVVSEAILIPNTSGLHARPAAVLANMAKGYASKILLQRGDDQANAKSVVSIMRLNLEHGAKVQIVAEGPDAAEAVNALAPELASGLGDEGTSPAPAPATQVIKPVAAPVPKRRSDDPNLLLGVSASPGLAVGTVFQLKRDEIEVPETGADPHTERRRLDDSVDAAKVQLEALQAQLHGQADPAKAAIFAAHQELLEDPDLIDVAESVIAKGKSSEYAWQQAYTSQALQLEALPNELLAARAADLRDVGRRVLSALTGQPLEQPELPVGTVLIAEDLTPSDTASLDRDRVVGFCTVGGGATSHVAILARALDLPAVAGIEPQALEVPPGTTAVIDGARGTLRLNPDEAEVTRIREATQRAAAKREADIAAANEPATTTDGHRVEVVANVGGIAEAEESTGLGGEGVGLLRSEFLFLARATAPTEDEQTKIYQGVASALGGRTLIIRTLDVGGDKPLPYLPLPREENPFLGVRGVRLAIDRPEILRTQIRAILRVTGSTRLGMMFPMISSLEEFRSLKQVVQEETADLGRTDPIQIGIMVEVPSAAVMAEQFAREADFFSIGTNDLTQYTLAMDRGHPKLAPMADAMNPAVLKLIGQTVEGAHAHGKWVGVCGGIASDEQAVPILVGLGVDELSVSVPALPSIKATVRRHSLEECQALARKALSSDSAADVRALVPLDY